MTLSRAPIPIPPPTSTAPLPEQCTLDALAGPDRMRRWQRLAETADPHARRQGGTLLVRYRPVPGVLDELNILAAAEADCCSFAEWQVSVDQDVPTLQVTAKHDADAIAGIAALFGAEDVDDVPR